MILAGSISAFAGEFSDSPIWILHSKPKEVISEATREKLHSLNAHLIRFEIDQPALEFPFAGKVFASAAAESLAEGQTELLIWMDSDSIVINEPKGLLLGDRKHLGCRPVDRTLIGSPFYKPIDEFWELIYQHCRVPEDRLFPMIASVDENVIRPYINAGLLVVRPERGLLRLWRDYFNELYRKTCFEELYCQNKLYRIFFHQAVLAGSILSTLGKSEIQVLSHIINYPLHMHTDYPADRRPRYMNELITCRYDTFFDAPNWREVFSVKEPLKGWLKE